MDPSRPAIIIGTVDLIGSRLLFSGYRPSYKLRPLDAGLLGQDTFLVLDEAHLSQPFEQLLKAIGKFQRDQGSPMRVMRMSATTFDHDPERFKLEDVDIDHGDSGAIWAKKALTITRVERKVANKRMAKPLASWRRTTRAWWSSW